MSNITHVTLREAKAQLSKLGKRAADGEVIVVTTDNNRRFRIVSLELETSPSAE